MRRTACFLACLLWAASARGAAPGLYEVADFGHVPGQYCDAAVEAAYQAARAYGKPATIHFGPGSWRFRRPFLADLGDLTIRGEGRGTTRLSPYGGFAPIILGVGRTSGGKTLTPEHRPDAFGKLDTYAAPRPGVAYGYRTLGAHLGFWSSPFDRGASDGWRSTRKLTIAWCSEGGPLRFGMFAGGDRPNPWAVLWGEGKYALKFRTADGVTRAVTFPVPGDPAALHRVAVQVDLEAGSWQAYADKVQTAGGTLPAGLKFMPTDDAVFAIGQLGPDLAMVANTEDRTVYGFRITDGLVYKDQGVGKPQLRRDGAWGAGIDTHYVVATGDLIACLLPERPPEWLADMADPMPPPSRLVPWRSGDASGEHSGGYGLFLHSGFHGGGTYNPIRQSIRGLTVDLNYARWGQALTVGGVLNLDVRDVELMGGWQALGSAPMGPCWPTTLIDVTAQGYDSSVALVGHSMFAQRINCAWAGTTAMRLKGCSGTVRDVWINGQTVPRAETTIDVTGVDDASFLTLDSIRCNQEGYPYPTIAAIRATPGADYPEVPMVLTLRDIRWGNVGPAASLVRLEDGTPQAWNKKPCHFALVGAFMERSKVGVATTGPRWRGTVDPGMLLDKTWLKHDGPGESGVRLEGAAAP